VRPQVQAAQTFQQLQQQQQLQAQQTQQATASQQAIALSPTPQTGPLPTTGHPAYFNGTARYFGVVPGGQTGTPTTTATRGNFGRR
jgi:hypothetical protein